MPSFYNAERNYVITTNLKVMYSTLSQQPSLQLLRKDLHAAIRVWLTPGVRRYFLVRNPYDRLVSFYADKFQTEPAAHRLASWQDCQRIFFPALGLCAEDPPEAVAQRLRALPFDRFTGLLPHLFRLDRHLWPQYWGLRFRIRGLSIPAPFDRILKIEQDRDVLAGDLGIDLTVRANVTAHDRADHYFSAASYAVVNDIYRQDFERFGYPLA